MIIDAHAHLGSIKDFYCPDNSLEDMLSRLKKLEIENIINAHYYGLISPEYERGAEEGIELYEKTNGVVLNYFNYNPKDCDRCLKVIEEYAKSPAFVAIKIHPSMHHVFADDAGYEPVWQIAEKYDLPIMSHTWGLSDYNPNQKFSTPDLFEKFVKKYDKVNFIFGHSGGRTNGALQAVPLAAKYKNAYLDIAGDVFENNFLNYLVKGAGSEKVLFGSDINWFDPSGQIAMVLGADISNDDRYNIFKGNALKLFRLNK